MRIKYIVPWPLPEDRLAELAGHVPTGLLARSTEVDFVAVRASGAFVDCYYEDLIFELYVVEAGLRAEDEGYDAVIMDSVSDSGLYALRSRLEIPVVGPGLVAFHVAATLGKRFTILTLWERWIHHYDKVLDTYGIRSKCASIRSLRLQPNLAALDAHSLFEAKGDELFAELAREACRAIEDDGADTIVLGSTTMAAAARYLSERLPVPVVNPGPVALKLTEALIALGLSHSKVAFPSPLRLQDAKLTLASQGPEGAPSSGGAVWRLRSH